MKMRIQSLLLFSLCFAISAIGAEPPVTSLEQAEKLALEQNPGIQSAQLRWRSALEKIPQAEAFPDPKASYTYYIESVETRVGPQEQAFALQQTLPWFGKRGLRGQVAAAKAEAARQAFEQTRLDVLYQVRDAYYDLYFLQRSVDITEKNLELLTVLEETAQSRYKTGGPMLPLIQLQTELGKLADRISTLRAMRPAYVARLNALLNRPETAEITGPTEISETRLEVDEAELRRRLQQQSPALKRLQQQAESFARSETLARKDRWPDVTLGVKYIDTSDALGSGTTGSGTDPVMATVSVNLPIWSSKYSAAETEAALAQQAVLAEKSELRNSLEARLATALFHYHDAERKIDLYRDTLIPKAEQALNVARQAFEGGKTDFISLIDAERMWLEFELQHERAHSERARQLALIEKIVGTPLLTAEEE